MKEIPLGTKLIESNHFSVVTKWSENAEKININEGFVAAYSSIKEGYAELEIDKVQIRKYYQMSRITLNRNRLII